MKKNYIIVALTVLLAVVGFYGVGMNSRVSELEGEIQSLNEEIQDKKWDFQSISSENTKLYNELKDLKSVLKNQKEQVFNLMNDKSYTIEAVDEDGEEVVYYSNNKGLIEHRWIAR